MSFDQMVQRMQWEVAQEAERTFEQLGHDATESDYFADAGRWLSRLADPEDIMYEDSSNIPLDN